MIEWSTDTKTGCDDLDVYMEYGYVHWDATGTTLVDASTQWCPSGDPVLICIIGTHWKTTGKPLEDHWKHTGISPVAFQCTLGCEFQAHWIATRRPLAQGKGMCLSVQLAEIMSKWRLSALSKLSTKCWADTQHFGKAISQLPIISIKVFQIRSVGAGAVKCIFTVLSGFVPLVCVCVCVCYNCPPSLM